MFPKQKVSVGIQTLVHTQTRFQGAHIANPVHYIKGVKSLGFSNYKYSYFKPPE